MVENINARIVMAVLCHNFSKSHIFIVIDIFCNCFGLYVF